MKCLLIGFLTTTLCAQPKISAVISAAGFDSGPYTVSSAGGLAIEGLATVFGSGLATRPATAISTPWPKKLGETEVFVCSGSAVFNPVLLDTCAATALLYVSPSQINFQIPDQSVRREGTSMYFAVRVAGMLDMDAATENPRSLKIYSSFPAIFFMGYDCLIDPDYQNRDPRCGLTSQQDSPNPGTGIQLQQAWRGAVTDSNGRLLTSSWPAKLGQYYTIWLTGLGEMLKNGPADQMWYTMTNIPLNDPNIPLDTRWYLDYFGPSYVGMSPQFPGLYQINFQLPIEIATGGAQQSVPAWPCGDYNWEIGVYVDSQYGNGSEIAQIPIQIRSGDVPCSP